MVHNYTDKYLTYSASMDAPFAKARILKSWDDSAVNSLVVKDGKMDIKALNIPPFSNIIILNSNITEDFISGYLEYKKVFK